MLLPVFHFLFACSYHFSSCRLTIIHLLTVSCIPQVWINMPLISRLKRCMFFSTAHVLVVQCFLFFYQQMDFQNVNQPWKMSNSTYSNVQQQNYQKNYKVLSSCNQFYVTYVHGMCSKDLLIRHLKRFLNHLRDI